MTRAEILKIAKPILFNTEMVCKVLDGTKTATRRPIKPQPTYPRFNNIGWLGWEDGHGYKIHQPYRPGDIMYVRETWAPWSRTEGTVPEIHYKADEETLRGVKWRPSIHMPKEATRIFLRVTDVRVERLQDILDDPPGPECQIVKEGCKYACDFSAIWDSTIKPADRSLYGWDANPWVWCYEFERVEEEK